MPLWVMATADAGTPNMGAVLKNARFISYTPRSFSVVNGQTQPASLNGISCCVMTSTCLIIYSCSNGLEHVPAAADKLGYLAVIVGIWDPKSEIEIQNAIRLSKKYPKLIFAISIENEGIYAKHYWLYRILWSDSPSSQGPSNEHVLEPVGMILESIQRFKR